MIYFDQAASSFPKPKAVADAVYEALTQYGANPGRGGHRLAQQAAAVINETRAELAHFFGVSGRENVLFYANATGALNQAIKGLSLQQGDHVITTSYEHNSVRRPLEYLKSREGIEVSYFMTEVNGHIDQDELDRSIRPTTKLIAASHGSNLTGMITDIEKMAEVTNKHEIPFLVDASQTAGVLPINMGATGIDMLAFPGHKGLLGPQGTGVLLVKRGLELEPILHGGTGAQSEAVGQPEHRPERNESGTMNTPGIAGLRAGLEEVKRIGIDHIYAHEKELADYCIRSLNELYGFHVLGPNAEEKRLGVVSFTIEAVDVHEAAIILDQHYDIAVRAGLHCTPLAHQAEGTAESGAIRASFGPYNEKAEVDQLIGALQDIQIGFGG